MEKKTAEHDIARFGPVTGSLGIVTPGRPVGRWILIMITLGLLLIFLILTLLKDPLRIFREGPPGQARGGAAQQGDPGLPGGPGTSLAPPALGPHATRLPSETLSLSIRHPDPTLIPPLQVQGLASGKPPVCWVPRDDEEELVIDAGEDRSWSHLLLHRCSLPGAGASDPVELNIEVGTPGGTRSRLLRLRSDDAPTRVDLGGILSDQLILTLQPTRTTAGLSGVVGYYFEEQEP